MKIANAVKLYRLTYINIKCYWDKVPSRKKDVVLGRLPYISKVRSILFRDLIWWSCSISEPLISLLWISIKCPFFIYKSIITKPQDISDKLILDYERLMTQRVKASRLYDQTEDWLRPLNTDRYDNNKRNHVVFEFLSVKDVLYAFFLSAIVIIDGIFINKFRYVFRNNISFEFFLTYICLQKLPDNITIYFCNQIDRWAVMFDNTHQKNKVLLQHGLETPTANWPIKFNHVNITYVMSKDLANDFLRALFNNKPIVLVMGPTISLTKMENRQNKKAVLLILFPGYGKYSDEVSILEHLSMLNVDVYAKTHPGKDDLSAYYQLQKRINYTLITNQLFPDVDFVISYRSTLAVEYQAYKKNVFIYTSQNIASILNEIDSLVNTGHE